MYDKSVDYMDLIRKIDTSFSDDVIDLLDEKSVIAAHATLIYMKHLGLEKILGDMGINERRELLNRPGIIQIIGIAYKLALDNLNNNGNNSSVDRKVT